MGYVDRRAPLTKIDCPCCGGALHMIDDKRSEQLDIVPFIEPYSSKTWV